MSTQLSTPQPVRGPIFATAEIALGCLRAGEAVRFRTLSGSLYTFTLIDPNLQRGILEGERGVRLFAHSAGSVSASGGGCAFAEGLRVGDHAIFFTLPLVDGRPSGTQWQQLRTSPLVALELLTAP